jgi:sialate O-acetylesterase
MRMNDQRLRFALMDKRNGRLAVVLVAMFVAELCAFAQPTPGQPAPTANANGLPFLSPIFGDNMVLQRGKADAIWGWSDPGDSVRVQIGNKTTSGIAGADRRWEVKIEPPAAGGPYGEDIRASDG